LIASALTTAQAWETDTPPTGVVKPAIPAVKLHPRLTDTTTSFWRGPAVSHRAWELSFTVQLVESSEVKGSRMQLSVWYSSMKGSSSVSASEDHFERDSGGIPVGATDAFRGANIMIEGGGGINVNRTKVSIKVVEEGLGVVDAACTHYYARDWLAVRLRYGDDRALRLYLRNNNTKEWSHCSMLEEVDLPKGWYVGLSSPGQVVNGDELRMRDLEVQQLEFPTRLQEVAPVEFSRYASAVGAYMALPIQI